MKNDGGKRMDLYAGLSKRAPKPPSGGTPEKCTVNADATRSGTAPTPATISGRTA